LEYEKQKINKEIKDIFQDLSDIRKYFTVYKVKKINFEKQSQTNFTNFLKIKMNLSIHQLKQIIQE
jgi:uncharacterized protein (UPF0335 family)